MHFKKLLSFILIFSSFFTGSLDRFTFAMSDKEINEKCKKTRKDIRHALDTCEMDENMKQCYCEIPGKNKGKPAKLTRFKNGDYYYEKDDITAVNYNNILSFYIKGTPVATYSDAITILKYNNSTMNSPMPPQKFPIPSEFDFLCSNLKNSEKHYLEEKISELRQSNDEKEKEIGTLNGIINNKKQEIKGLTIDKGENESLKKKIGEYANKIKKLEANETTANKAWWKGFFTCGLVYFVLYLFNKLYKEMSYSSEKIKQNQESIKQKKLQEEKNRKEQEELYRELMERNKQKEQETDDSLAIDETPSEQNNPQTQEQKQTENKADVNVN